MGANARFADNSMGNAQLDEFTGAYPDPAGYVAKPDDVQRLHTMLTRTGTSDQAIKQGLTLTQGGLQKIAGKFGISTDDVSLLLSTLSQELRKEDSDSTEAILSDYYTTMGEGIDVPMVIRTIPEGHTWKDSDPEDKETVRKRDKDKTKARELKSKRTELDEKRFVDDDEVEDKEG
jgi:hypothetical protein